MEITVSRAHINSVKDSKQCQKNDQMEAQILCYAWASNVTLEDCNYLRNWISSWRIKKIMYLTTATDLCTNYINRNIFL
jgi:hypothetical protein